MNARAIIEDQMRLIAQEHNKALAPLADDLALLDSGLDSLCLALLTARLEDEFGVDAFMNAERLSFPVTLGALTDFYEEALADHPD